MAPFQKCSRSPSALFAWILRVKWWATRDLIGLGLDGEITVLFGDGEHVASLTGTPDVLRRVAATIVAQVESAIVN